MVTTLSLTSMNQGKIAPRYDLEPKSVEAAAEEAACRMELEPWHVGQTASAIWKVLSARFGLRIAGRLSHAQNGATIDPKQISLHEQVTSLLNPEPTKSTLHPTAGSDPFRIASPRYWDLPLIDC